MRFLSPKVLALGRPVLLPSAATHLQCVEGGMVQNTGTQRVGHRGAEQVQGP